MRREVEEYAAAGAGLLTPGVGLGSRTEAIVSGFETEDAAEVAGGDGLAEGLEIGVEAAVVVDGEDAAKFFGEVEKFDGFRDAGGERLVDDDVAPGFEAALGEGEMGLVRSGDGDELEGIDGEEFVKGADNADVWVELRGGIAGALENCDEAEARNCADYRCVETTTA